MNPLKKYNQKIRPIIAIVISAFTAIFIEFFKKKFGGETSLLAGIAAAIVGLISYKFGDFFENIISNCPKLRQCLDKENFMEGYWYDFDENNNTMALYLIEYKDDSYTITGNNYNNKGVQVSDWSTIGSFLVGKTLYSVYESKKKSDEHKTGKNVKGYFELKFSGNPPETNFGCFMDTENTEEATVNGFKVTKSELDGYDNFSSYTFKSKFVCDKLLGRKVL